MRVWMFLIGMTILGCGSSYPTCTPDRQDQFRCNGNTVEICDGAVWHPQYSCEDLTGPDGEPLVTWCKETNTYVGCVDEGK